MAEVLLILHDKGGSNANHTLRAGDIIDVHEDGHQWTSNELSTSGWLVVKLPGLDPSLILDLISPVVSTDDPKNPKLLLLRGKTIDLSKPAIMAFLATASGGVVTVPAKVIANFLAAKTLRAVPGSVVVG